MDSNHSPFTRKLAAGKGVRFVTDLRGELPKGVGIVLQTRFVSHAVRDHLGKTGRVYSKVLGIQQVKRVLHSCEDLLVPQQRQSPLTPKDRPAIQPDEGLAALKKKRIQLLNEQRELIVQIIDLQKKFDTVGESLRDVERSITNAHLDQLSSR